MKNDTHETMNSLPQRGRVGVGEESKQNSSHFIPKPLPPQTLAHARQLRANMTDAETKLWQSLRREQLGVKFRKQHPMPPYIIDFYCIEKKLAIEIDGGQHAVAEQYDAKRTQWLNMQGVTVLRFWNNDVLNNLAGVLEVIMQKLKESALKEI